MERRQRENDRQMQSLIRQTRRLKEENEELCAQMSSAGPSQSRQPRSQQITLKCTNEASFLRNAEFPLAHMMRSEEEFSPNHEVQLDEIFDSTQVSTKRRCDRRSRLSDAMQVGLGP